MKVCVIGGGISGLTAAKSVLEEDHEVVIFEKTADIGGLWRYRDEDISDLPSVMKTTVIDTSKEMSALSDFPPAAKYANFMHNTSIVEYFTDYAKHFKLLPHFRFNHTVTSLEQHPTYEKTGKWTVKFTNKDGASVEETFDAAMICTGHHCFPYQPKFAGEETFEGKLLHTHSYKSHAGFEDKTVMVVGIGNSGSDVTVELSRVAKHVYWSTRRGAWIAARVGQNGVPWDLHMSTRFYDFLLMKVFTWNMANDFAEKLVSKRMDHAMYNLKPKHRFFQQHVTVGDDVPNAVLSGKVTVKGDIERFTKKGVIFKGEEDKEYPLDVAILATGYSMKLDFISDKILPVNENKADLYRMVFPPNLKHPTLAVIGFVQPYGAIFPVAEMQSRWAVRVFAGKNKLPSKEEMMQEVEQRRQKMQQQFVNSQRHTVEANFIEYMDEIAELIHAKPDLKALSINDFKLWYKCVFGPCLPYQYRLTGPHSWSGARDAIMDLDKRMRLPLSTRADMTYASQNSNTILMVAGVLVLVLILFTCFYR